MHIFQTQLTKTALEKLVKCGVLTLSQILAWTNNHIKYDLMKSFRIIAGARGPTAYMFTPHTHHTITIIAQLQMVFYWQ